MGHATRVLAVVNALRAKSPDSQIYIRAHLLRNVFDSINSINFHLSNAKLDVGVIEKDLFSQNVHTTLAQYAEINSNRSSIVEEEQTFIREKRIDLVVSDIPPIASDIGAAVGIPTIAIGNFSWDFIYQPYVERYPQFKGIIDDIQSSYAKTNLLLRLPLHHEMVAFPNKRDIPLIARQPQSSPESIRSRLDIHADDSRRLLLVELSTENSVSSRAVKELVEAEDYIVLSFLPLPVEDRHAIRMLSSEWQVEFPEIVQASDVVISKLGYGIVSECIAGHTPLLYVPRDEFAEFDVIRNGMQEMLPSHLMPRNDFLKGGWYRHIEHLLAKDFTWPTTRLDGANVASDIILNYAG